MHEILDAIPDDKYKAMQVGLGGQEQGMCMVLPQFTRVYLLW